MRVGELRAALAEREEETEMQVNLKCILNLIKSKLQQRGHSISL